MRSRPRATRQPGSPIRIRRSTASRIQGVSREYIHFSTFDAERGRPISPTEVDRERPVAILGYDTAEQLFGPADPIDKSIRIGNIQFRVVGVSEKKGSIFGQSQDEFAVVPIGVFQKMFGSRMSLQILVKPRSPDVVKAAMDDATVAMRIERRLRPAEPDNFGIFSSDSLLAIYHTATNGLFAVLIGVVALSLVVGGIVIMNIMLMVVSERTREIGLRKALGARKRDIIWQILTESVTLSTFGGMVGVGSASCWRSRSAPQHRCPPPSRSGPSPWASASPRSSACSSGCIRR